MGTRAGATLLYGINVLAIVLAAIVVLLATDFIRSPSLRNPTVAAAAVATLIIAIALVVPAWQNSRQINDEVTFAPQAEVAVEDWTSAHPTYRVVEEEITPGAVMLVVASPSAPAELDDLAGAVATEAFPQPTVSIEWVRSATITDATPTR